MDKINKKTVHSPPHKNPLSLPPNPIFLPNNHLFTFFFFFYLISIRFVGDFCDNWQCPVSLSIHHHWHLHEEQSQEEEQETRRCYSLSVISIAKRWVLMTIHFVSDSCASEKSQNRALLLPQMNKKKKKKLQFPRLKKSSMKLSKVNKKNLIFLQFKWLGGCIWFQCFDFGINGRFVLGI